MVVITIILLMRFKKNDNITTIYYNHNSIDYIALITVLELYYDYIDEYYAHLLVPS